MSDRTMNFIRAGAGALIGLCCLGAKVFGLTDASWPYAGVAICAIITVGYLKQALDKRA